MLTPPSTAQVETLLKDQGAPPEHLSLNRIRRPPYGSQLLVDPPLFGDVDMRMESVLETHSASVSPHLQMHSSFDGSPMMDTPPHWPTSNLDTGVSAAMGRTPPPSWDLISMGLDEALPAQAVVDALYAHLIFEIAPSGYI
jgi:hypothetical protein